MSNFNIEFHKVSVEFSIHSVEQFMSLSFEIIYDLLKLSCQSLHTFQIVSGKSLELLDVWENIDQFLKSSAEGVEFTKNLSFTEIKGLALWHVSYFILSVIVSFLIWFVQLDALTQNINQFTWITFPDLFRSFSWLWGSFSNSVFAVLDHLVCYFHEQTSHLISSVVESSNSVDHLNSVH